MQSGTSAEESVVSTVYASKDPCENLICCLKLLANLHDEDSFDDVICESVMEKEHAGRCRRPSEALAKPTTSKRQWKREELADAASTRKARLNPHC